MEINFLKYKKIYFVFSGILILGSMASVIVFGFNPGIDFTGGSILEIEYIGQRPSILEIRTSLADFNLGEFSIQPSDDKGVIIRMKDIPEQTHQDVLQKLSELGHITERRFESLGPVIGKELKEKTTTLSVTALLAMLLYIVLAFRKIKKSLSAWRYGIVALISLFHDIAIPIGVFSFLGEFYGVQFTIPIVIALLTVVGYAINNVVVVFDRVRENIIRRAGVTLEETINKSISQTITRCVNTSLTTVLVLSAILFFGGVTLKYFSLALMIGIASGTYSAIFLAGPLLTIFKRYA